VTHGDADCGIVLGDGTRLEGLVVWTTGVAADGHALLPEAATSEGRLLVDRTLRVSGRVLAAGDVAAHRDLFGVRVEPREIRLGPYRGEAFRVDRRAIGFICVGHRLFLHCRCYLGG
jgi:hypothetical protein